MATWKVSNMYITFGFAIPEYFVECCSSSLCVFRRISRDFQFSSVILGKHPTLLQTNILSNTHKMNTNTHMHTYSTQNTHYSNTNNHKNTHLYAGMACNDYADTAMTMQTWQWLRRQRQWLSRHGNDFADTDGTFRQQLADLKGTIRVNRVFFISYCLKPCL